MKSEFESRGTFECIFGGEDGIDLSKDETGDYSFQPSRFAYSFFLVAWQHQQTKVDELQKRVDAAQKLIDDWNFGGVNLFDLLDELEQALKGGSDE